MPDEIHGFEELRQNMEQLEILTRREALNNMAKAGGAIVRDQASALAPRGTGALAEGMTMRMDSESSAAEVIVRVGPDRKQFYGHFQEFGTSHHAANPFLEPAVQQSRGDVERAMGEAFWKTIPENLKS